MQKNTKSKKKIGKLEEDKKIDEKLKNRKKNRKIAKRWEKNEKSK